MQPSFHPHSSIRPIFILVFILIHQSGQYAAFFSSSFINPANMQPSFHPYSSIRPIFILLFILIHQSGNMQPSFHPHSSIRPIFILLFSRLFILLFILIHSVLFIILFILIHPVLLVFLLFKQLYIYTWLPELNTLKWNILNPNRFINLEINKRRRTSII